jgi:hypothetical protein
MDMDELATPGYSVLSPATKSKLATLPKGELMIRHPHFTQPIFLRFPRPAVMAGRDGVRRFEPADDLPFEDAIARQLRRLDRSVPLNQVKDLIAGRDREEVLNAVSRCQQARPDNVLAFFRAHLKKQAPREVIVEPPRAVHVPADPYGF